MKFIPYDHFTITTSKTPEQLCQLIQLHTAGRRPSLFLQNADEKDKPFYGNVSPCSFTIAPVTEGYRNSFIPFFQGRISEQDGQTILDVHMRLHGWVRFFLIIWMIFCAAFAAVFTIAMLGQPFRFTMLVPYLMLLFGYAMSTVFFWAEGDPARETLIRLIDPPVY